MSDFDLLLSGGCVCFCVPGTECNLQCLGSITDRPEGQPINDVRWLSSWKHRLYKVLKWAQSSDDPFPSPVQEVECDDSTAGEADIIASAIKVNGQDCDLHTVMVDLDLPAILVPSGTPGNSHLYIDRVVTWEQFCGLLDALEDCGIVQPGYVAASKARGYTALRLPWKPKRADAS